MWDPKLIPFVANSNSSTNLQIPTTNPKFAFALHQLRRRQVWHWDFQESRAISSSVRLVLGKHYGELRVVQGLEDYKMEETTDEEE